MFGADKRYLSISINEATIKVAQVKSSGSVEKIARASAGGTVSTSELAQFLKSLLNGFDRHAPVVCVIPASAVTSKSIDVPSSDPQEIRSIINLQAGRHTPYSREEVLIGYVHLGTLSGTTKLLLVIAHRNVVKDRMDVLERAGLTPEKVLFAPEGIGRLYAKGLNLKRESPPLGIIDFSTNFVNFVIVARGGVVFCRSIPMGIKNLVEAPDGAAKIAEELNKSLAAYQSEDSDVLPPSFVVTTDHTAVKDILPALKEGLRADVRLSPYVNLVKGGGVRSKLQRDYADDSFLDVIAPVATIGKSEINLMPEELVMKHTVEQQSKEATKAGIAAVIIMLLLGATFMSKIYFKDTFLNKNLRGQYASQKEEVQKLEDRMAKTRVIKNYLQDRLTGLDAIRELYRVTPQDIYLNSIDFSEDGTITLAGVSASLPQVYTYVKTLDDSPMFKGAKTKSTSTKKDGDKDVAMFEVVMKLSEGR